ncbi:hypothetical protein ACP70R_044223 [Stipagrostis hirtigluma subsp. patula]
MRRSSSGARVLEGGGAEAALPTFDPQSAVGRREAARTRALGRAVHCIPVVLLLCALVLWLSASTSSAYGHAHFALRINGLHKWTWLLELAPVI